MADDFGDTPLTAGSVLVGASIGGNLEVAGDRDWFGIQLIAGHTYLINDRGAPSGVGTLQNPLLRLYNSAGVAIGGIENDDSGHVTEAQLVIRPTVTGIYYIEAAESADANTGTYVVDVQDLGTGTNRFQTATLGVAGFGVNPSAGGWGDFNTFPRGLGDVDGDGTSDVVGFGADGTYVSRAVAVGTFAPAVKASDNFGQTVGAGNWDSQNHYPRALGDVNGDGRSDVVGFHENATVVALGQADGTFGNSFNASAFFGASSAAGGWTDNDLFHRTVADINGDGRADIIGFGNLGVFAALGQADGTFAAPILSSLQFGSSSGSGGWNSQNIFPRLVADVNGDGRGDIVAFGAAGVFTALGQADGTFAAATQASTGFGSNPDAGGWTSQNLYTRLLGDINADGRADIVGFGAAGTFFALGQAGGTFGPTTFGIAAFGANPDAGGWTDNNIFGRAVADVTSDGRADIVGFGAAGVFTSQSIDPLLF